MKKYIVVVTVCLFVPIVALAGTWSHRIVKDLPGGGKMVEFTRSPTGDVRVVNFSVVIGDGSGQLNRKKWNLEAKWSQLNNFDMGADGGHAKEILWKLVTAIRNNPDLTVTQATTWYDTNYPDGLYSGIQLLKKFREWIADEYGVEPTWEQFKTYVIDNTFKEVDTYAP